MEGMKNFTNSVCVMASLTIDMIVHVKSIPKEGETVFGYDIKKQFGGRGTKQALAAHELGEKVKIVGKVGYDVLGNEYLSYLTENGIDIRYIKKSLECPTGTAFINRDEKGENTMVVVSGANQSLTVEDIEENKSIFLNSKIILSQYELPVNATQRVFQMVKEKNGEGVVTIFNPAPANEIPKMNWNYVDILVLKEGELAKAAGEAITNRSDIERAAKKLLEYGIKYIIIILGKKGFALISQRGVTYIDSLIEKGRDAAEEDSLIGTMAAAIAKRQEETNEKIILESLKFAAKAEEAQSPFAGQKK